MASVSLSLSLSCGKFGPQQRPSALALNHGSSVASKVGQRRLQRKGKCRGFQFNRRHLPCKQAGAAFASIRDAEELIRSGAVRSISPEKVSLVLAEEAYGLLDVRPIWERQKAYVAGSCHVPLFVEDEDSSAMTFLKKWIQMGYGGMWMGQKLTTRNKQFVDEVQRTFPKESKVLVVCGEGLRSLLAIDELWNEGYEELAWITGGFNNARDGDFGNVEGTTKLQFASIGGAAEYMLKLTLFVHSIYEQKLRKQT